ncbi:MAG: hypothetical protein MJ244_04605, partial [Clostridia bacterium]|nr:hypothetical protein [Clostridia bacterium]
MKVLDNREVMYGSVLQEYNLDEIEFKSDYSYGTYIVAALANNSNIKFDELVASSERGDIEDKFDSLIENDKDKVSDISWLNEKVEQFEIYEWEVTTSDDNGDEIVFSGHMDSTNVFVDKSEDSKFDVEQFLIDLEKYINSE